MSNWDTLKQSCENCRACPLHETKTNCVFGVGNPQAKLMFVGEAPGEQEDLSGIPFVGRAGQLLDKFLFAVDLSREDVYIANILKCRPPHNRDPLPAEEDACIGYLRDQVRLISPRIIVCLGRIAAGVILHEDYRISQEHGQWIDRAGIRMTAVYHPAALLRNPSLKGAALTDFLKIKEEADALASKQS